MKKKKNNFFILKLNWLKGKKVWNYWAIDSLFFLPKPNQLSFLIAPTIQEKENCIMASFVEFLLSISKVKAI